MLPNLNIFKCKFGVILLVLCLLQHNLLAQINDEASIEDELFLSMKNKEQNYLKKLDSLKKSGEPLELMKTKNDLAWFYVQNLHDIPKGKAQNNEVLEYINETKDSLWHGAYGATLTLNAMIQMYEGLNSSALQTHFKALALKQQDRDTGRIAYSYLQIGKTLSSLKRYEDALSYYFKSQYLRDKIEKPNPKLSQLIGTAYRNLNQLQKSKEYYQKSLEEARTANIKIMEGTTMAHLGEVYYREKEYEKALAALDESLQIRKGILRPRQKFDALLTLTKSYRALDKLDFAERYASEAYKLSIEYNNLNDQKNSLKELINLSRALNDVQAELKYFKLYEKVSDELYNFENLRLTIDHQTLYESQEKENKILEQKIKIQDQRIEKNILSVILLFLAGLGIAGFFLFRNRLNYQKNLSKKNKQIQEQKILKLNQEKKLIALNSMVEGQESERRRIAGDLHDGLGGLLTNIKAHFHALDLKFNKKDPVYHKTNVLIDEACSEVRRIAKNMTPNALKISGLKGAIEDIKEQLSFQGIDCEVYVNDSYEMMEEKHALIIYRIIQECINNIQKHANADYVLIHADSNKNYFSLLIEDNGLGFNVEKAKTMNGLGLKNLDSRVRFLNGKLAYESILGKGTTITLEIPKQEIK